MNEDLRLKLLDVLERIERLEKAKQSQGDEVFISEAGRRMWICHIQEKIDLYVAELKELQMNVKSD